MNLQAPTLLGNEKETNVFDSRFNKIDRASFNQIANETNIVSSTVLENWINVTAGRSQPSLHISNLRNRTKHTLFFRIQLRTN